MFGIQRLRTGASVIVPSSAVDDDWSIPEPVKDISSERFAPKTHVDAFEKAVFPGRARSDIGGLAAPGHDPEVHAPEIHVKSLTDRAYSGDAAPDEETG